MSLGGFTSPFWFLLLVAIAALTAGYVWMQRRRRRQVLRFANLAMLERVAPRRQGWQRHLPLALLLASLVMFTVALAGPTAEQKVPRNRATVMLVIDVSLSMRATDIEPSRPGAPKGGGKGSPPNLPRGKNRGWVPSAAPPPVWVPPPP